MTPSTCRFCGTPLGRELVDLGLTPLANSLLNEADLSREEPRYPLAPRICDECHLVQLQAFEAPEGIFSDYPYFSSYSQSWLDHAKAYAEMISARLGLGPRSLVLEVASNDGYLLTFFKDRSIPVLGVDPAANVAEAARARGIPTLVEFFGKASGLRLAAEGKQADLLAANNVICHVPDLNDFVAGIAAVLKPSGVATIEFPHLLRLLLENQFDTIYHEHFSYLSLHTARRVFSAHGLNVFDVEKLPTHGGSLRLYLQHASGNPWPVADAVQALEDEELRAGLTSSALYERFAARVMRVRRDLPAFLRDARGKGLTVAGYGAAAKGNTLLNFCGITRELLPYVADISPHKQGRLLPGSRIPVLAPQALCEAKPDFVLILPWNIREEVMSQLSFIKDWGGRFVTAIPEVRAWP